MTDEPVTIVISSAGRRLYLIDWFRAAFDTLGLKGRIIVAENDASSAAASYGDETRLLPRYTDPDYGDELLRLVDEVEPRLFLSANDYELMQLHVNTGIAGSLRDRGVFVPGVSAAWQIGCADKLRMARMLEDVEVLTPRTVKGSELDELLASARERDEFVVKHRFGSRSSGLAVVSADGVRAAVANSAKSVPPRTERTDPRDDVIVQPRMPGSEYGVDIVSSLLDEGSLSGVFARRKLRMRAGETDKAVTVDPGPFREASGKIAQAAGVSGLIDVDMFLDDTGRASVIDINPRFGGGYPFVHLAGADVPLYYTGQIFGIPIDEGWNQYEVGVISAKYQETRVTARGSLEGSDSPTAAEHA